MRISDWSSDVCSSDLDEPTGNLDTAHGEEVMRMLQTLNAEGSTIVMVTHSPAHADYAGRVVQMLDGCIPQQHRRAARDERRVRSDVAQLSPIGSGSRRERGWRYG